MTDLKAHLSWFQNTSTIFQNDKGEDCFGNGWFIDPGVLVDDDGKVYIYCGYQSSFVAEINPDNMYEIIDGTYQDDIIPIEEPFIF